MIRSGARVGALRLAFRCAVCLAPISGLTATVGSAQDTTFVDSARRALVVRNVNLRPTPSTATPRIRLLRPPDELVLREDTTTHGFYPVVTDEDELGWVWARNIRRGAARANPDSALELRAVALAATFISADWEKPDPNRSSITIDGRRCGADGRGGDSETNLRKNRTDTAATYHDVAWDAIAHLPYPIAPRHRHDWSPTQLAEIARFEGTAVRTVGYLVALKPQGGSGESTNCFESQARAVDWHLALVAAPGQGEEVSVVVETTPRVRRTHPGWTPARLQPWVDADSAVRISGWLMLDPEHRNHLGKYRGTLWEIHPVTRIEVQRNDGWVNLENLP